MICVHKLRHDYSTPVTTATYAEIEDEMPADCRELEIFDSSGQTIQFSYGASGSEIEAFQIIPGGNGRVKHLLNKGMRLAVKAISGNATAGELTINFYR